ncbi:hypothetical protein JXA85_04835 [Candidatus Woesearchaeota archaeon]|nr:hypothetical protein [Candidatus Woesearchaeota archaeon]
MKNYSGAVWGKFIESFRKFNADYLLAALYDALFWIICFGILFFNNVVAGAVFNGFDAESISGNPAMVDVFMAKAVPVLVMFALSSLTIFFLYSLFRALIWSRVVGKRFRFKLVWMMLLVNSIIGITSLMIVTLLMAAFFPLIGGWASIPAVLFILFSFHLLAVFYYSVTWHETGSIKKAFFIGIKRITRFFLPYLFMAGAIVALLIISMPVQYLPEIIGDIVSAILLVIFVSWTRFFLAGIIKKVEKK